MRASSSARISARTRRALGLDQELELVALAHGERLAHEDASAQRPASPASDGHAPPLELRLQAGERPVARCIRVLPRSALHEAARESLAGRAVTSQDPQIVRFARPHALAPRALLVDDEPSHLEAMQALVERQGFADAHGRLARERAQGARARRTSTS